MHVPGLIRRGRIAALVGGTLFLVADLSSLMMEMTGSSSEKFSEQAATTSWTVVSGMFLTGGILIMIGLVALYARQVEEAGILGLAGFLLAFVWMALVVGAMWTFAFVAPTAAIEAPAFLDSESPAGPLNLGFAITFMGFPLGWLVFGIATFRARVFSRLAGGLLAVGALVAFAPLPGHGSRDHVARTLSPFGAECTGCGRTHVFRAGDSATGSVSGDRPHLSISEEFRGFLEPRLS